MGSFPTWGSDFSDVCFNVGLLLLYSFICIIYHSIDVVSACTLGINDPKIAHLKFLENRKIDVTSFFS